MITFHVLKLENYDKKKAVKASIAIIDKKGIVTN